MPKTAKHLAKFKFKKGQSGNPKGKIANPAIRALRKLTIKEFRECIEAALSGNIDELRNLAEDTKGTALQMGIARAFLKAIKSGDYTIIEKIAERIIGKIPDEVKIHNTSEVTVSGKVDVAAEVKIVREKFDDEC